MPSGCAADSRPRGHPRLTTHFVVEAPKEFEEGHWLRPCGQHYPRQIDKHEQDYLEGVAYLTTLACRYPTRMSTAWQRMIQTELVVQPQDRVVYTPWFAIADVAHHVDIQELIFCVDFASSSEDDSISAARFQITTDQTAIRVRRQGQKAVRVRRHDPYGGGGARR